MRARPTRVAGRSARVHEPLVLRGLVAHWPVVRAGRESPRAASAYLRGFYRDATVGAMLGGPGHRRAILLQRRPHRLQFQIGASQARHRARRDRALRRGPAAAVDLRGLRPPSTPACPASAPRTTSDLGARQPLASIWIGNRTRIAAHHDLPDNLACVVAGHRRFTLFPPEQLANLYIGPLDFTPAGQPISMVDFAQPDYDAFPRFAEALKRAHVAELGPGDAIFIPEHVVASHRVARRFQRAGQLLVAPVAGVHGFADRARSCSR